MTSKGSTNMRTSRMLRGVLVSAGLLAASAAYAPPFPGQPYPASSAERNEKVEPAQPPAGPPESWFKRQPFEFDSNGWKLDIYGVVEWNLDLDSTRSFQEGPGNGLVAREGTYNASVGRMIMTPRNSRIGFKMQVPTPDGIKTPALFEGDFDGNQPASPPTGITEASYYT